jgi:hypothetical protein
MLEKQRVTLQSGIICHLKMETESCFRNVVYIKNRTIDDVQKHNNFTCSALRSLKMREQGRVKVVGEKETLIVGEKRA